MAGMVLNIARGAQIDLSIHPGPQGLPTQGPTNLQDWISQTAQSQFRNTPLLSPHMLAMLASAHRS